jgi:hypothetical protein
MTRPVGAGLEGLQPSAERERWPVIRTGERDPIPALTRALVYGRDDGRCVYCGASHSLELDHLVPWSAGGPDTSDNLRMLCGPCNSARSNYRETYLARIIPVVAVCDPCLRGHDSATARRHSGRLQLWTRCPHCRGDDFQLTDDAHHAAWCGTCRSISWVSDSRSLL